MQPVPYVTCNNLAYREHSKGCVENVWRVAQSVCEGLCGGDMGNKGDRVSCP